MLDKLLDGSGDTVCTEGNEEAEYVAEIDGDDEVVEGDNTAVGVCEVLDRLDGCGLDSIGQKVRNILVNMRSPRYSQPIATLRLLVCFGEGRIRVINFHEIP